MDSQVARDGRLMELVDEKWRDDKLPMEEVAVPQMELPEIEPDNGPTNETLKEQEQKWSDLALSALHDQPPTTSNHWFLTLSAPQILMEHWVAWRRMYCYSLS